MIPAVADYEVCGELLGLGAIAELRRLDALRSRSGGLDVRAAAFDQAAEFWALLRRGGLQTAGDAELNGDAILAVVAVNLNGHGDVVTIAMNHMGHIERFPGVEAREWHTIS